MLEWAEFPDLELLASMGLDANPAIARRSALDVEFKRRSVKVERNVAFPTDPPFMTTVEASAETMWIRSLFAHASSFRCKPSPFAIIQERVAMTFMFCTSSWSNRFREAAEAKVKECAPQSGALRQIGDHCVVVRSLRFSRRAAGAFERRYGATDR